MKNTRYVGFHMLVQAEYKHGDQPPEGYLAWHEWAETQHLRAMRKEWKR